MPDQLCLKGLLVSVKPTGNKKVFKEYFHHYQVCRCNYSKETSQDLNQSSKANLSLMLLTFTASIIC